MRLDNGLRFAELTGRKTSGCGYRNLWSEPEFCLAIRMRHVNVDSGFFSREEEQPELTIADDRGCHERNVPETTEADSVPEPNEDATCVRLVFRLI